jgi:hypothetical protein
MSATADNIQASHGEVEQTPVYEEKPKEKPAYKDDR